jgi:septum formation protein
MLREKLAGYKIILASGSPRRQQFMRDLDLDFEIRVREVDEVFPPELKGEQIPKYLAKLKAQAFNGDLADDEILITSDTIVWLDGESLGKAENYTQAFEMLRKLSGKTHEVITSVCFTTLNSCDVITDTTKVTFNPLSDQAISYYLDHYRPYDKAGSYGIQDWIGLVAVAKIEGSYVNVMGMPTDRVVNYLLSKSR